ncbi:T9SS type A sorting domain-containing protein [Plebeiibacterium sediminum]|uniref:T9SS type A sorting domain-containing protein n=1 Tax=Plebeiibacterium sediminum TaxID=2992112 RepID=A0AAE3M7T1_9BACT|nr:T9SS type A sorting domain-containing protein [Plebeiobacterium sediminum]MCW3788834.1 T9SS type A sorting domain-containing protein [Plebeiobacterium sediminum]
MKNQVLVSIALIVLFNTVLSINCLAQEDASSLDKDKTLDVVTWNLEWFGAPIRSSATYSYDKQLTDVSSTILSLDADVYALQEVVNDRVNGFYLQELVNKLNEEAGTEKYVGFASDRYSFSFNEPSTSYPSQCVCYILNTQSVSLIEQFPLFDDIYESSRTQTIEGYNGYAPSFWSSGRLPYFLKAIVSVNGKNQIINFVNIHAKCCSDSEDRRENDGDFLLNTLVTDYGNDNIIVLGDYNDDTNTPGPYDNWYADDHLNFMEVAGAEIDHISISNELYDENEALINNNYVGDVTISDHDPVMIRLKIDDVKTAQTITLEDVEDQIVGSTVTLSATNSSDLPVEYIVLKGNVTVDGNQVTFNTGGEVLLQAIQTGNDTYSPAFSNVVPVTINKYEQTIEFDAISDKKLSDSPFELVATSSLGFDVSFEVIEGNVSIEGNVVTLEDAGNVTIRAYHNGDDQYESAEAFQSFYVEDKSGIEDEYAKQVKIYPNPGNHKVTIDMPDASVKQIDIYNITGDKVYSMEAYSSANVYVDHLSNGLYFIQITSGNITISKKLQVKH